jgi:lysine 2,3-aminomutase
MDRPPTPDRTLTGLDDLVAAGLVAAAAAPALAPVAARYAIAVTPAMAALIPRATHGLAADAGTVGPGAPALAPDPIARQFVPDVREREVHPAERADPIGDLPHTIAPGVVHRYPDRALLKLTGVCLVYCRFCFRREMVGPGVGHTLTPAEIETAVAAIAARPAIFEVILTGGDPLVLAPRRIADVGARLAAIDHVKVLRWHTRVPVVAPERVTADLVAALRAASGRAVYVAVHANHPRELTPAAVAALGRLIDGGVPVVSQTVLLRGVNDDVATLDALMRAFLAARVLPYYLHHGDLAPGTAHFRTTIAEGQALVAALRRRLSGLAQPTYVLDIPGGYGKVPIGPETARAIAPGRWAITDPTGRTHVYEDAGYEETGTATDGDGWRDPAVAAM